MSFNLKGMGASTQTIVTNFKTNWINIAIVFFVIITLLVVIKLVSKKLQMIIEKKISEEKIEIKKRTYTLNSVLSNLIIALSLFIGILIIIDQLGISIVPIITGAGVVGVILGFGAQNLIKDLINGSFILFEQQFQVNDIVTVGDFSGVVERFNLRTTVLRDLHGVLHHIPNSEIKVLSNCTHEWARAIIDVGIHYKENVDRVVDVLEMVFDDFVKDKKYKYYIIERPEILGDGGLNSLDDSAMTFKIICKVKPPNQWTIERQLRKRIKDKFDEVGIEIPYPCRNIYMRS